MMDLVGDLDIGDWDVDRNDPVPLDMGFPLPPRSQSEVMEEIFRERFGPEDITQVIDACRIG